MNWGMNFGCEILLDSSHSGKYGAYMVGKVCVHDNYEITGAEI